MKKITLMALVALMTMSVFAEDYTTAGDGTTWTLTKLSETAGSGVTKDESKFTMANTVVISKNDRFELEPSITVLMGTNVNLEIEGTAKLDVPAGQRVLFTRSEEGVNPGSLYLKRDDEVSKVANIDFEYAGLKNFGEKGLEVDSCTFRNHVYTPGNGSSAINMAGSGAEFVVRNCIFEKCERSAVGGASNAPVPVLLENCQFLDNGTNNRNYPQVNLTAATQVTIRQCVVIGNREKMRVGGIVVSNLTGSAKNAHLLIENCYVQDCSYGISVYSDQTAIVRNNVLLNNNCIANANQGGSGLNVTDVSGTQNTQFMGNVVIGSLWGATVIGGKNINFGRVDVAESDPDYNPGQNVFLNNGNGEPYVLYDLYNNSANTVYAQNNFWLSKASFNPDDIEECIFDKKDQETLGEVIYQTKTDTPTSVSAPAVQRVLNTLQAVYNLQGMRTDTMQKGLNIVQKEGKTIKVLK